MSDGGPAFPCMTDQVLIDTKAERVIPIYRGGMSLRDYFAAQAIQGKVLTDCDEASWDDVAEFAYGLADAMLKERKGE